MQNIISYDDSMQNGTAFRLALKRELQSRKVYEPLVIPAIDRLLFISKEFLQKRASSVTSQLFEP